MHKYIIEIQNLSKNRYTYMANSKSEAYYKLCYDSKYDFRDFDLMISEDDKEFIKY